MMRLNDKIIELRKQRGWSQEELAQQLGVTRQSVSKWEGAQSVPDIEKIVQMSRLFHVSTDYLLKEENDPLPSSETSSEYILSLDDTKRYLTLKKRAAPRVAIATFLCIVSPVVLIGLGALAEANIVPMSENMAGGIGLCTLLLCIAIAVATFISSGATLKAFDFLEQEPCTLVPEARTWTQQQKEAWHESYTRLNIIGTVLCILCSVPLFAVAAVGLPEVFESLAVCAILILVGLGCIAFIYGGTRQAAFHRLLEEEEYTREKKALAKKSIIGPISAAYWLAVTAIFLFYTFGPYGNGQAQYSWFIWAVAGVLYAAIVIVIKMIEGKRQNKKKSES